MRLPDFSYDGHSKCAGCIGKLCSVDDHCLECAEWSNATFDRYLKHRHVLELTRLRKAKQRAKAKQLPVVGDNQQAVTAHSLSPSPTMSVVSLSSSSPISPYTPSASTRTIPSTPPAVIQAPSGQVISRDEFDSLKAMMMTMASDLAALRSGNQAHSDSVPQPSLAVPSTSGVDSRSSLDRDPTGARIIQTLVDGSTAPEGVMSA